MNPVRADELRRDFVRMRQYKSFGWPYPGRYNVEEMEYLEMLEQELASGRIQVQGGAPTWRDWLKQLFIECRNMSHWSDLFLSHDEQDKQYFYELEENRVQGKLEVLP